MSDFEIGFVSSRTSPEKPLEFGEFRIYGVPSDIMCRTTRGLSEKANCNSILQRIALMVALCDDLRRGTFTIVNGAEQSDRHNHSLLGAGTSEPALIDSGLKQCIPHGP